MVSIGFIALAVVAGLISLFVAWVIGAGSSGSTPFAPAVGAGAISVMRAGFLVGLMGLAGAILQGENVTEAVGSELLVGASPAPAASSFALLIAGALVAAGVFRGYPIATAFTVTGAIVGAGLALGRDPNWSKWQAIAFVWVLTPPVGGSIAYGTARFLRAESVSERHTVSLLAGIVGAVVANIRFAVFGRGEGGESLASMAALQLPVPGWVGVSAATLACAAGFALLQDREMRSDERAGQFRFLLALGALVAFSAGGSQVGLAIGPLLPIVEPFALPLVAMLVGGGLGILAGSWMGAPRMIKALSQDYSSLGPRRAIAALIPAFLIAQTAVAFGIPISFNETVVSSIVGSGFAAGTDSVSMGKWTRTVAAWIGSLAIAAGLGYAGALLLGPLI